MAICCHKTQLISNDFNVGSADISYANPNDSYVESELNLLAANLMQFSGYSKCHLVAVLDDIDWQF